jgi:hypothetical protein
VADQPASISLCQHHNPSLHPWPQSWPTSMCMFALLHHPCLGHGCPARQSLAMLLSLAYQPNSQCQVHLAILYHLCPHVMACFQSQHSRHRSTGLGLQLSKSGGATASLPPHSHHSLHTCTPGINQHALLSQLCTFLHHSLCIYITSFLLYHTRHSWCLGQIHYASSEAVKPIFNTFCSCRAIK